MVGKEWWANVEVMFVCQPSVRSHQLCEAVYIQGSVHAAKGNSRVVL